MYVIKRICRDTRKKSNLINYIYTTTIRSDDPTKNSGVNEKLETEQKKKSAKKNESNMFDSTLNDKEKEEASKKLQFLLNEMNFSGSEVESKIQIPQSQVKKQPKRPVQKELPNIKTPLELNLLKSVKDVADDLGGNVSETESDLIHNLKRSNVLKDAEFLQNQETLEEPEMEHKLKPAPSLQPDLKAKEVSERLKGILGKITNIDKHNKNENNEFLEPTYTLEESLDFNQTLGILKPQTEPHSQVKMKLWDYLEERELQYLAASPPRNYYEELIMWTNQGKLWHFPIDNEQGMDEESQVDFTEHIFLDKHLEPWCPKAGPIRHFMELVTVGLSKNPFLTVEDKKEHIFWYRDYFESKKKILQEVGVMYSQKTIDEPKKAQDETN